MQAATTIENLFHTKGVEATSDELFAVDRCVSRLTEMQSKKYMDETSYFELHEKDQTGEPTAQK